MLQTTRLTLQPIAVKDAAAISAYALQNADHLAPWSPTQDDDYHSADAWAARLERADASSTYRFGLRLIGTDPIIGLCTFSNVTRGPFQACYLGYSIAAAQEGKGLMFEALSSLIPHIFETQALHRIMANYMPHNTRSGQLLERLGFEKEGLAKRYLKIAGNWEDHVLTSRINDDV